MDCQQIQDILVELAYDELAEPSRQIVIDHLGQCPTCQAEFARLTKARAALKAWRADEPAKVKAGAAIAAAGAAPAARPPRNKILTWLVPAMAAAAAIVAAVFVVRHTDVNLVQPAYGQDQVKIERVGVAVTIMTEPPEWAQMGGWPQEKQQSEDVSISDNNEALYAGQQPGDYQVRPLAWPGMALVRDQRLIVNLRKGATEVKFTDVPAGIMPDTVRMQSVDDPKGLTILEQNYQYDLANAWAILHKYIDKSVTVQFKDGTSAAGKLLSYDANSLVIMPDAPDKADLHYVPPGPRSITRKELVDIAFEKLPDGLLTRPTLLWKLDNQAQPRQQLEVAYLTTGLKWRADYVLKLRPAGAAAPATAGMLPQTTETRKHGTLAEEARKHGTLPGSLPGTLPADAWKQSAIADMIDSADIVGYATVSNNSGVSYKDAQLKLMAGDLHLILPHVEKYAYLKTNWYAKQEQDKPAGFTEKSFFEYHLYTLGRPIDLADREVKQLELVTGSGMKLRRSYVYNFDDNQTAARVVSEMMNSKANGLGVPLPKGVIRMYAPDPDGIDTYVAQTQIDHTPTDEMVRLPWGYAFDIACGMKQTDRTFSRDSRLSKYQYSIRNHKDQDINVTVIARVPETTRRVECPQRWHVREVGTIEIYVPVKANSETKFDLSIEYGTTSGGGLKSPDYNTTDNQPKIERN